MRTFCYWTARSTSSRSTLAELSTRLSPTQSASCTTRSISTQEPMGICTAPQELRACLPLPPNTSWRSSDAPFATKCCAVKFGADIHQTKHLYDALQLFQILQFVVKSCQQINR